MRRIGWILVFAAMMLFMVVTSAWIVIRSRLGPPNPQVRQYIEENPEVLTTLPQGVSEEAAAMDDSMEQAMARLLDKVASRLPQPERDEARALWKKRLDVGIVNMTRDELHRMRELDYECKKRLTTIEKLQWRADIQRLAELARAARDR